VRNRRDWTHARNYTAGVQIDWAALRHSLQRYREAVTSNKAEFSRLLGLHRATVHRVESGTDTKTVDLETIRKWLEVATDRGVPDVPSRLSQFLEQFELPERDDSALDLRSVGQRLVGSPAEVGYKPSAPNGPSAPVTPLSAHDEQLVFLDRLAWAFLRCAEIADRDLTAALAEELVVCIRRVQDRSLDARAKAVAEVRGVRTRRHRPTNE
jgi:transcriptional regulator with XRE-family HTH domain